MNVSATVIKNALKGISTNDRQVIAENVGISLRTLLSAAAGKTDLGMDTIAKLSKELNVNLFTKYNDLLLEEDAFFVQETASEPIVHRNYTTLNFTVKALPASFANFGEFIFEMRKVAETYGLEII